MWSNCVLVSVDRSGNWLQYVKLLTTCIKFLFDNTSDHLIVISNSAELNGNWQQCFKFLAVGLAFFNKNVSHRSIVTSTELYGNWQQSVNSLTGSTKCLFDNNASSGSMSDGSFEVRSQTGLPKVIHVHRLILAMRSEVFQKMFYGTVGEAVIPIKVTDITAEAFEPMLRYIYTDDLLCIDDSNVLELMYAAHKYDVRALWNLCLIFAEADMTARTVLPILVQSDLLGADGLISACYDFMAKTVTDMDCTWLPEVWKLPPKIADNILLLAERKANAMDDSVARDHLMWRISMVVHKMERKEYYMY